MTVALALLSALAYGVSDFVGGLTTRRIDVWTTAAFAQVVSLLVVVLPAVLSDGSPAVVAAYGIGNGLRWRRDAVAGPAAAGVLAAAATVLFQLATQSGLLTVASVLTALYPAMTVLLAAAVLKERIARRQAGGLALAVVAVALVAAG